MTTFTLAATVALLLVAAISLPGWLLHRKLCTCGHQFQAHQHYQRGTGCAICSCPRWRRVRRARRAHQAPDVKTSAEDDAGWAEVRTMLAGYVRDLGEVHRRLDGDPPPSRDQLVCDQENQQQKECR
jgi:hypothetical protein